MKLKIYVIAGESSGDYLGANLIKELLKKAECEFRGIGGNKMHTAGLNRLFSFEEINIMGFSEIIPKIPKLYLLVKKTVNDIINFQPDILLTIDSPGFNLIIAKKVKNLLKKNNVKLIHYVAPTVWAYKPSRAKKFAKIFDGLITLFPFEIKYFTPLKLETIYSGHPIFENNEKEINSDFFDKYDVSENSELLLLLPGSRKQEIDQMLPLFIESARKLCAFFPSLKFAIIIDDNLINYVENSLKGENILIITSNYKEAAFKRAKFAISKAGTITLELAKYGVPHLIAHKMHKISVFLLRRLIKIKYVGLVNILADKEIIPELLQEKCDIKNITKIASNFLPDEYALTLMKKELSEVIKNIEPINNQKPSEIAANFILKFIK